MCGRASLSNAQVFPPLIVFVVCLGGGQRCLLVLFFMAVLAVTAFMFNTGVHGCIQYGNFAVVAGLGVKIVPGPCWSVSTCDEAHEAQLVLFEFCP